MDEQATRDLAAALGASRNFSTNRKKIGSPLEMSAIANELGQRLKSSGGRPTDPKWTLNRQIPFREESWEALKAVADGVGSAGRRVGASHVAAVLVERGLTALNSETKAENDWKELLGRSRRQEARPGPAAAERAGVTFVQLVQWSKEGLLSHARKEQRRYWFSDDEIVRAIWLRMVAGQAHKEHLAAFRSVELDRRYLVWSYRTGFAGLASATELAKCLAADEGLLVLDQVPARERLTFSDPGGPREGDDDGTPRLAAI